MAKVGDIVNEYKCEEDQVQLSISGDGIEFTIQRINASIKDMLDLSGSLWFDFGRKDDFLVLIFSGRKTGFLVLYSPNIYNTRIALPVAGKGYRVKIQLVNGKSGRILLMREGVIDYDSSVRFCADLLTVAETGTYDEDKYKEACSCFKNCHTPEQVKHEAVHSCKISMEE